MSSLPSKTSPSSGQAHTPGPWKHGRALGGGFGVWVTPYCYGVLDSSAPGINAEANARLIASAPELLAACQDVRDLILSMRQTPLTPLGLELTRDAVTLIESALRSAT